MTKQEEFLLKEKIMNDKEFRTKCYSFGVRWDRFRICERLGDEPITIVIDTPNKDVVILMDEHYNVIGVHRFANDTADRSLYSTISDLKSIYKCAYVFYNLTIADIVEIANRVEITSQNHFNELRMIVNGQDVDMDNGKIYIELLSYIKFLGKKIDEYYHGLYKAKILGLEYPSVISYVMALINNIDNCINDCIKENKRPWSVEVLSYIGENKEEIEYYYYALFEIIKLLLYEKGFKIGRGDNYLNLEVVAEEKEDMFDKTDDLRAILDVPKEVVNERFMKARETLSFEEINLEEFFSNSVKKR